MCCIYKITSPTGRIYIGQTINFKNRLRRYEILSCVKQRILFSSFKKYGFKNHKIEVIEYCLFDFLNERERYWQDFYNVTGKTGLNIRLTMSNDKKGSLPQYVKDKISKKNTGVLNGMYGKPVTDRMKKIQREKLSGENNYLSKWLVNTSTGIYYPCLREAAVSINLDKRTLWQNLNVNKKNKTNFIYA